MTDQIKPVKKKTNNDALDKITAGFKVKANFFDTQVLTYPENHSEVKVDDDLSRELSFYKQSLWAAKEAENMFKKEAKPFRRPDDYFAEMLKTDEHMQRIRQKLLDEQAGIKASEEAKKQRQLKKFGKQVQTSKLMERQKEKRALEDKVKSFKQKRKRDNYEGEADFDVDVEEATNNTNNKRSNRGSGNALKGKGKQKTPGGPSKGKGKKSASKPRKGKSRRR